MEIRGKKLHHVGSLFFNLDTLHKIEESMLKVNIMVIITNSSIIMVIITTSIYLLDDNHIQVSKDKDKKLLNYEKIRTVRKNILDFPFAFIKALMDVCTRWERERLEQQCCIARRTMD